MATVSHTLEMPEALYDALAAEADRHGRTIEDYWSERLNARLRGFFADAEAADA